MSPPSSDLGSAPPGSAQPAPASPIVWVDTFRSGLLAALGHDLRLRVERFEILLESSNITAELDLGSLRVLGAMSHGRLDPSVPSARDREEIESAIPGILDTRRFPKVAFAGKAAARGPSSFQIQGELRLHGVAQQLSAQATSDGSVLRVQLELVPSRFAIAPYRALGGALKLQDRVAITIQAPLASLGPSATALSDLASARARFRSPAT